MQSDQQQRILGYFIEEARDHLNTIEQGLLNLQDTLNDPEMVNEVFRAAHSIKGGAAMLGLTSIQQTSHRLEDCFKVLKEYKVEVDQKLETLFLGVSDTLKALLDDLSSPFGLSEETANNLMAATEPIIAELNQHLEELVQSKDGSPVVNKSISAPVEQLVSKSVVASTNKDWSEFQNQVLQSLRAMLQLFKQDNTSASRERLQQCCQQLLKLGEQYHLSNWSKLCQSADHAISNPDNTYLTLAKIIITEIKQAQELVIQGRESEISVSQELEALELIPEIELLELNLDWDDQPINTETELAEIPVQTNTNNLNIAKEIAFDLTSNPEDSNLDGVPEISLIDTESNVVDFNSIFEDHSEELKLPHIIDLNGLEVGSDELGALEDLFQGETPDFDTWQQESALLENGINSLGITDYHLEEVDEDLVEFLSLDNDEPSERLPTNNLIEDLNSLFGENISKSENVEIFELNTTSEIDVDVDVESLINDVTEDLPALDTVVSVPETITNSDDFDESLDSLFAEELGSETDRLLAPIGENINQPVNQPELSFADNNIEELLADTNTEIPEELALAEIETQEYIPEISSSDLFGEQEEELNETADDLEISDLFALPVNTDSESVSEDDINNFWTPFNTAHPQASNPELEQNGAKELEESLFAASGEVADSDDQQPVSNLSFYLGEFEVADNAQAEITDPWLITNSGDNLFADLENSISTPSIAEETQFTEIETFSQDIELLELIPESSSPATNTEAGLEFDLFAGFDDDSHANSVASLDQETIIDSYEQIPETTEIISDQTLDISASEQPQSENLPEVIETALELNTSFLEFLESGEAEIDDLFTDNLFGEVDLENLAAEIETSLELDTSFLEFLSEADENTANLFGQIETTFSQDNEHPTELELPALDTTDNAETEFAELDSLLDEELVTPKQDSAPEDNFADLEALLKTDNLQAAATIPSQESVTTQADKSSVPDEFMDLETLLAEADQTINSPGRISKPSISKTPRPTIRRIKEESMKIPVKQLDDMSNLVGELVVNRNTLEQDHERLRMSLDNLLIQVQHLSDVGARMEELYERSLLEASLLKSRRARENGLNQNTNNRGFESEEMDEFNEFHLLARETIEYIVRLRESASDIDFVTEETERVARQFRQVTTQLQEGLTRARMVPFAQTIDYLRRGVRDNAIKYGKQVELETEGAETPIDKMIVDHLKDPLTHMLNNAIAHGIELPSVRTAAGKPPTGKIFIRAFHQGNQTVISVTDDGAGINPEKVKKKAIEKGIITPEEGQNMSRADIYELLFLPSFSTADEIDDIKGRGVGMNVVINDINEIRGTVTTDSSLGKGTTFTIRLPLTLSICKALCCLSDKSRIAFPMDGVEDTLDIPATDIQKDTEGQSFIKWRDTVLPFRPLQDILAFNRQIARGNIYSSTRDDDMVSVVVVRSGSIMVALQIEQVLSEQEIVIKQFEGPAPKPSGVAGATVLGDGRIMPIADVLEIIDIFQGKMSRQIGGGSWQRKALPSEQQIPEVKIEPTVLIVDDSITVRELLSLSFNKAGYRVEQARDGQEAWDKLRSGLPCDIVFCDIEMPRCDGLELLSRISKDSSLNHLPIAMLTSRGADKHRQMAFQLGASGYFTKPYLEEALLEAASRMLKGEKLINA
ncbi:response regulator [Okeanomitos corallinicola TIOX110]|uniref:histidine kinase n=1 Tax=Okeanomitos corallinicola TIOX110 TaxID=3133117 RepID=A0ABZ2UQ17_9CYAN